MSMQWDWEKSNNENYRFFPQSLTDIFTFFFTYNIFIALINNIALKKLDKRL